MARAFLWLGWPMSIYIELFARQIEYPSTHPSINLSIVLLTYLLTRLLAFCLLLLLGSATDDSSDTPLTTLFQYPVAVGATCMHDMVGVSGAVQVCRRAARIHGRLALSVSHSPRWF